MSGQELESGIRINKRETKVRRDRSTKHNRSIQ